MRIGSEISPGLTLLHYFRGIAVVMVVLLASIGFDAKATEVTPYEGAATTGTAVSVATEGYDIEIGEQQFSLAQIENMPAYQTKIKTHWNAEGIFIGVNFVDLLHRAGIEDFKRVFARASNDYKVTISSDDAGIDQALLAYSINGALFDLNNKGPYWLIWPEQAEGLLTGEDSGAKWIWSVVEIRKVR